MKNRALLAWAICSLAAASGLKAQLVAPPTFTSISLPSSATLGSSIDISATAQGNYSDNSDGNNWNSGTMPDILRITIQYEPPGGSWTTLTDWMPVWQTPNSTSTSLTMNTAGTWYVSFQAMDGRPWYSSLLTYAVVVSPPPSPSITSSLSVSANQGQYVSYQITASQSPTSFSASSLPAGLTVNSSTGVISGYIGTTGAEQCTIGATNAYGTGTATLTWSVTAASITCNASVSPNIVCGNDGQTFTLTRNGSANFGIAWTQGTIWLPSGAAEPIGNLPLGSMTYTPDGGVGVYWYQFRLVDNYNNYQDQWISFTVGSISPLTITTSGGQVYDGTTTDPVINFGQSVTVNATDNDSSGQLAYAEFAGDYGIAGNWAAYGSLNSFSARTSYSFSMVYQPAAVNDGAPWIAAFGYSNSWWGRGFNLYVNKATPAGSFSAITRSPTAGAYTILSGDLNAAFSNPYSNAVTGPSGAVTYKIAGTNTAITAGSVIPSGSTSIEADYAGDSNYNATSVTVTFTILGPTPPTNLQDPTDGTNSISLTWTASTSSAGISNYQIYRNGTLIGTSTTTSYTDATVAPNTAYTYAVTATDNSGYVSVPTTLNVTSAQDFEVFTPIP